MLYRKVETNINQVELYSQDSRVSGNTRKVTEWTK